MGQLVPQELEFADTAPLRAEGRTLVEGTAAEVWAVLLDYERWPVWFAGVKQCRATSDPATGVGSTREVVLTGGATVEERFIGWEEGGLWSFTATAMKPALFRSLVERVTIEDLGPRRTQVTYRMAVDPSPALKLLAPALKPVLTRNLTKAMASLAHQVTARR